MILTKLVRPFLKIEYLGFHAVVLVKTSIDMSITTVGLVLTKLRVIHFRVQTDTISEPSYGNMLLP